MKNAIMMPKKEMFFCFMVWISFFMVGLSSQVYYLTYRYNI